jgi:hypothetical protein
MLLSQLEISVEKKNLDPCFTPYTSHYRWIIDLNLKAETIKLIRKKLKGISSYLQGWQTIWEIVN